jgi:hypothetical protein
MSLIPAHHRGVEENMAYVIGYKPDIGPGIDDRIGMGTAKIEVKKPVWTVSRSKRESIFRVSPKYALDFALKS